MVVGRGGIFYQNFSNDADARAADLVNGDAVKVGDHLPADPLNLRNIDSGRAGEEICADCEPLLMHRFNGPLFKLIGSHSVHAAHENIAENRREGKSCDKFQVDFESRIILQSREVGGNDGNLLHSCLFQGAPDKADIVGGAASAAGLRHNDRCPVEVIFSALQRVHDLADDKKGRVAGVVVYIFQSHVHGLVIVVRQDHDVVAAALRGGLNEIEMDRRHLRAEDRIAFPSHLFRKGRLCDGGALNIPDGLLFVPDPDSGDQGSHADPRRAEVVDLVDLKAGVNLIGARENIAHLVGGNGIDAAAERVELDQLQVIAASHIARGRIQTGVVHPLVQYAYGTLRFSEVRDAVLGKNGKAVGGDHLGDAVVDFGVDMIGTSRKDNSLDTSFFYIRQNPLSLMADILADLFQFLPGVGRSRCDFSRGNLRKLLLQGRGDRLKVRKGHERHAHTDRPVGDFLHVVADILRIGGHDGAVVVVVGLTELLPLVEDCGIEDEIRMELHQPLDVPVGQLCGVALGLTGDGFNTHLINFVSRRRRYQHLVI